VGSDQYHEPATELPEETRTFARMIASPIVEAEAINWYQQRIALERDTQARAHARCAARGILQQFPMDLEFPSRLVPPWRAALQTVLFKDGDIVANAEPAEAAEETAEDRS
jgi:hypothetical protein